MYRSLLRRGPQQCLLRIGNPKHVRRKVSQLAFFAVHERSIFAATTTNRASDLLFLHSTVSPYHARYFSTAEVENLETPPKLDTSLRRKRRMALQKRRRRQRQRIKQQQSSIVRIVQRDREAFDGLFDQLASNYPLSKIQEVMNRLEAKAKPEKDSVLPLTTVFFSMLQATNSINNLQLKILEFLLSTTKQTRSKPTVTSSNDDDKHAIDTLLQAREQALSNELFWNSRDRKEASGQGRHVRAKIRNERINIHASKSDDELEQEAAVLAELLEDRLPHKSYRSVIRLFEAYTGSLYNEAEKEETVQSEDSNITSEDELKQPKTKGRKRGYAMRSLAVNLGKSTGRHFHRIAREMADFFYMNTGLEDDIVAADDLYIKSQRQWQSIKDKFVNSMLNLQDKLVEAAEEVGAEVVEEDEAEKVAALMEQTLSSSGKPKPKKKKNDKRFRRPTHLIFDATILHEATEPAEELSVSPTTSLLPSQSMVFIDNLPIDITESEIMDLYSRCGDIASVEIFNMKPELDPGPLNKTQLQVRKKQRIQSGRTRFRRWQRQRTPVYGLLAFADPEGYRLAVDPSLQIFGIVYRKHDIRSIRSADMSSLFIEGIPEGSPCTDFEYQLSQQLHPDVFVSLHAGQNNRAMIGSCEIKFPSFEVALESYHKLQEMDVNQSEPSCVVNWLRTPKNAEQWWTRKLGFD